MEVLFQIVTARNSMALTQAQVEGLYKTKPKGEANSRLRPELRDKPEIEGFAGPMWGGWRDAAGEPVYYESGRDLDENARQSYGSQEPVTGYLVRYETWEAYDIYSR